MAISTSIFFRLLKLAYISCFIMAVSLSSFAQTYTTTGGGTTWNNAASWDVGVPTAANSTLIQINHNITIPTGFTAVADQIVVAAGVTLTIASGGTLNLQNSGGTDLTLTEDLFILFIGANLVVNGDFINNSLSALGLGGGLSTTAFNSGGRYVHAVNGLSLPSSGTTWNANSTCEITGVTNTAPGNLNQAFGNFIWNCSGHVGSIALALETATIEGNLSILNSNSPGILALSNSAGTVDINGDFIVSGSSRFLGSNTANVTIDIEGDFSFSSTGVLSLLIVQTGTLNFNVGGDFTVSSGTVQAYALATATSNVVFDGSGDQFFNTTGGTLTNNFNWRIQNGSTVDAGTSAFVNGGSFTLEAGGTLKVGSPSGLVTGTTNGNVRVSGTRTYTANGNIIYNGTTQNLGNEWSVSGALNAVAVNLEITDGAVVTNNIIGSTSLVGNLTLTSGTLNIGNTNTLQIQSNFAGNGGFIGGLSSSNLTFSGSGTISGLLSFASGFQNLNNFTINRSGTILLGTSLTIAGTLSFQSSGNLDFDQLNGQTLTIDGDITQAGSGGLVSGNSFPSNLVVNGTGALTSLPFCGICGTNELNNVTLSRTGGGTYSWNSTVTITGTLNLVSGDLTHSSGLTMGNGSTIVRTGGTLINDRPDIVSGAYNVTYSPGSSISTGLELPAPSDLTQLNNLTINGPTVLTQNLVVNGNVSLSSGTFSGGTNTITMQGSTWSRAGGSFIPGTSLVTFNGVTSITSSGGNAQFGNIRVESGRTLNLPSSTVAISGNVTLLAGAIVNPSTGTILLNGSGAQNIGGGGSTLNNITVTKTGGAVNLTSSLGITGILNITTASTFASTGNLTLLSTSDGTSGNASIADLSGGGSVTGDVTVQRFMSAEARVWRYLSSPIQNATVASWKDDFPITGSFSDPSTAGEWPVFSPPLQSSVVSMYRYNETTVGTRDLGWEAFPSSGLASANAIEVGRGYSAFVRNTASTVIDVTGPINSGDINLPVTLTGTGAVNNDNGWNIVGNPYPSSIDWDSPNWTKTNISGVVQIRDDPGGIFQTWNGSIGSMGSGRIATGQGFWVQAIGSPTLTARESVKTNTTGTFYKQDKQVPDAFEIILSKGTAKDFAYLWFKEDATENVDAAYDAVKFNNDIFDFSLVMANGDKLAINTIPYLTCGSELKLDISTTNTQYDLNGSYTMEFGELGIIDPSLQLQLFDSFTNSTMDINDGASYSFDVTDDLATFGSERFKLTLLAGPASFEVSETTGATSCKPGSVVLAASGAPSGGLYKWYDTETAGALLLESSSSQFTTPELDKTKTYYVSVTNELGCESTRKAVQVEVINFDDVTISEVESELSSSYAEGNQWFRDDAVIPGATTQNYKPEETGLYKVEVSIGSCKTSAERAVTITGLEDESFFKGYVKIFPNPVSSELTIEVNQENSGSPRILDLSGREMGKLEMSKQNESWLGKFDFSGRAEGIYILQIADKSGKIFNKRIVKK